MRRSYMPRGSYVWKRKPIKANRVTTNACSSVRVSKDIGGRKPLGAGRRTLEWKRVWRWLKPRLEAAGRTRCEFEFIPHECCAILDPAHSKKRRNMTGDDVYAVAIACRNAHRELDEGMSHEDMEQAVWRAIQANGGILLPERKAA